MPNANAGRNLAQFGSGFREIIELECLRRHENAESLLSNVSDWLRANRASKEVRTTYSLLFTRYTESLAHGRGSCWVPPPPRAMLNTWARSPSPGCSSHARKVSCTA